MDQIPKKKYANLSQMGRITTKYGDTTRYEDSHKGVDIANKNGTPIQNMEEGTVVGVKTGQKNGDNGFGNSILVKDKRQNIHRYSHLKDILVKPGDAVKKDQPVATMGDTGSSYSNSGGDSSHLDYRIVDAFGKHKNPNKYLK